MTTDGMCGVPHSFSGPGLWLDTITFTSCSVLIFSLFIITEVKKWSESCSGVSDSLRPHRLYSPWNSLGHNSGVGSLSLLPGIFPTQRSNPGLLHCRQILYQLNHKGLLLLKPPQTQLCKDLVSLKGKENNILLKHRTTSSSCFVCWQTCQELLRNVKCFSMLLRICCGPLGTSVHGLGIMRFNIVDPELEPD